MATTYTDILLTDLESVRDEIRQKSEVRVNVAGDRCIIKWEGDAHQCINELDCVHRTHEEALEYYGNPVNGWCVEI